MQSLCRSRAVLQSSVSRLGAASFANGGRPRFFSNSHRKNSSQNPHIASALTIAFPSSRQGFTHAAGTTAVFLFVAQCLAAERDDLVAADNIAKETKKVSPSTSTTSTSPTNVDDSNLPIYKQEEVKKHNTPESRVWVTYHGYVYDVTDFVPVHPGGNKILLAAGGSVEPFWALYQQHKKDYVLELLEQYKIGKLDAQEAAIIAQTAASSSNPYAADPPRHPALISRSLRPYNGETPGEVLLDSYLTPQELLFTRNHLPVPQIEDVENKYSLVIDGLRYIQERKNNSKGKEVGKEIVRKMAGEEKTKKASNAAATKNNNNNKQQHETTSSSSSSSPSSPSSTLTDADSTSFTLEQLQNPQHFKKEQVISVLQCAGNRRASMSRAKPSRGLDWEVGAIGNGEWGGVRLRDVLLSLGVKDEDIAPTGPIRHIRFEGLDKDPTPPGGTPTGSHHHAPGHAAPPPGSGYAASVPADVAMDPKRPVLLAWEYNGAPLSRDHGYPLRVIVPGVVAARQVKWLGKISLAEEESESVWQRKDYKQFPPYQDWDTVVYDSMPALQDMPISSAIAEPQDGSRIPVGTSSVTVKGWAWSGAGRAISRVDISPDGGATWMPATITAKPHDISPSLTNSWGWTLWEAQVPIPQTLRDLQQDRKAAAASVQNRLVLPPNSPPPASLEPVKMELVVKAVDSACNTQPESPLGIWNYRGIANNSWGRVRVQLE